MQEGQFSGPDWVKNADAPDRFGITANVRPGRPQEQATSVLQNLLKERFHLAYHLEKKDFDSGALTAVAGEDGYPKSRAGSPIAMGGNGSHVHGGEQLRWIRAGEPTAAAAVANAGPLRFTFRMVTVAQLLAALQNISGLAHLVEHGPKRQVRRQARLLARWQREGGGQKGRAPLDTMVIENIDRTPVEN